MLQICHPGPWQVSSSYFSSTCQALYLLGSVNEVVGSPYQSTSFIFPSHQPSFYSTIYQNHLTMYRWDLGPPTPCLPPGCPHRVILSPISGLNWKIRVSKHQNVPPHRCYFVNPADKNPTNWVFVYWVPAIFRHFHMSLDPNNNSNDHNSYHSLGIYMHQVPCWVLTYMISSNSLKITKWYHYSRFRALETEIPRDE